jgi:UDP-N-acetyl-D-glucosamine dehydrogenase
MLDDDVVFPVTASSGRDDVFQMLVEKVDDTSAVIGVLGLGYVGLPMALLFAQRGYRVIGFDVSDTVVALLNRGSSHVQDAPADAVRAVVADGRFTATCDMGGLDRCDVVIVCVPTPLSKTRDPDVSYVIAATQSVAERLRPGQLVVLESTTYPGTTRELMQPMLERSGLRAGDDFFLCFSPERVDPGNATWQTANTPKVIGGITPRCLAAGVATYGRILERVVPVSSTEVAEMAKLLENTFRSINIALVNEMAQASERLGVDIWEVIDAAATKPFGYMKFAPGPGIGGHCIPLDPYYLSWKLRTLDYRMQLLETAGEINASMPHYVMRKIQEALNMRQKAVYRSRVLLLGVAYKPDIADVRESPALELVRLLEDHGAIVSYHDPHVPSYTSPDGVLRRSVPLTDARLAAADCVVVTTHHSSVDYRRVTALSSLVVDTRNATAGHAAPHVIHLSERVMLPHVSAPVADMLATAGVQ